MNLNLAVAQQVRGLEENVLAVLHRSLVVRGAGRGPWVQVALSRDFPLEQSWRPVQHCPSGSDNALGCKAVVVLAHLGCFLAKRSSFVL